MAPSLMVTQPAAMEAEPVRDVAAVGARQPRRPLDVLHRDQRSRVQQLVLDQGPAETSKVVRSRDNGTGSPRPERDGGLSGHRTALIVPIDASHLARVGGALDEHRVFHLEWIEHLTAEKLGEGDPSGILEYEPGAEGEENDEAVAQLLLRYRLSAATADTYADAGFTAIVQDVVLGEDLTAYVGLVRTRPLYVVVLAPRPETVAEREAGRAKRGYGAWTVAELDRGLREETPRIGLWLDTSDLNVAQTVDAIVAGRESARVA